MDDDNGEDFGNFGNVSPNSRLRSTKKWLSKPPRGAALLVMMAAAEHGGATAQLGEWPVDLVVPALAEEICGLLKDHCEVLNTSVTAVLSFRSTDGSKRGGEKVLKLAPQHLVTGSDSLASLPEQLTGDATSQAMQAQRHLEVMMRMQVGAMGGLFQLMKANSEHAMHLCETLAERVVEAERRAKSSERERDEMREVIESADGTGEEVQTAEAQNRIVKLLEPVIAIAVQRMLQGGSGPKPSGAE